jgi:uncharacterized protein
VNFDHLLVATSAVGVLNDIGRSVREAFFMFWETLWPLVLGFGLSGAVQAFVTPEGMEQTLGNHRPAAVARATGFGMVSSSCSYAASAMARSLFQKGADFVSSMVFMFASTNLVIELGIVLAVLIGWQFTLAEFFGGPIMILLLVAFGGLVLRPRLVEAARLRVASGATPEGHQHSHHQHGAHQHGGDGDRANGEQPAEPGQSQPGQKRWRERLASPAGWSDASAYTMSDLKMLRREMAIGYLVAGFLTVLVPAQVWASLFVHGHGAWTAIENAAIGPVIAFLSFVCSIGNVPLAAALWTGGISFGGVISFLFADLVAAPLVLIYLRYYGGALTLRIVGLFWVVMAGAGLAVGAIFSSTGLVPSHRPTRVADTSFHWDYTTFLNIVFVILFAGLYWLYRNRERVGGGAGYATDPVCGMQVRPATAPATRVAHGHRYWFCGDGCAQRFGAEPGRYLPVGRAKQTAPAAQTVAATQTAPAAQTAVHAGCEEEASRA